jgi:hypothetical protein
VRALIAAATAGALLFLAAACGGNSNGPATFVARDPHGAALIQWTRSGGDLKGSLSIASIQASDRLHLQTETIAFTGVVHDSSVTLTLDQGLGFTTNWNGSLNGKSLKLTYTRDDGTAAELDLVEGKVADYNAGVAAVRTQVVAARHRQAAQQAQAAAAAQAQQAQQQLDSDGQTVAEDVASVRDGAGTVTNESFAGDLQTMRADLQTTYQDLQTGLSDSADVVCSDAGAVDSDEGALESDQGAIESDIGGVESDVSSLQQVVATLRHDYQRYQQDAQAVPDYTSQSPPDAQQIQAAIADANAAIKKARAAEASARATGNGLVAQAKQYAAKADARCNASG